jgi:hypothetical protein
MYWFDSFGSSLQTQLGLLGQGASFCAVWVMLDACEWDITNSKHPNNRPKVDL